ncbi:MAG: type II toxin-antitoxin system RelN family antitoxin [Chroococcales cyanobacterium]
MHLGVRYHLLPPGSGIDAVLLLTKGANMKALKVMATIDERGQLTLDYPLITDKNSRVEVIVLIPESSEIEEEEESRAALLQNFQQAWHEAMSGQTIPIAQVWEGIV